MVEKVKVWVAQSCPTLCDPWTVAHQALLSVEFSRHEYWSWLPFPSPGDLPDPGIKPGSPPVQADSLPSEPVYLPLWWRRPLSIDWKTVLHYTEIISSFHFWMTNAPKLSTASLLRACTCSSSPDTSDPSVALSMVESLKLVPHASPNQPEDRGKIWGPPDPTALFPVDLLHGQERWSQFGVSVFTQMLIWEEWKVSWVWNLLKPVNLTSSVVKL